jgi:ELWxxDGT repeat protein
VRQANRSSAATLALVLSLIVMTSWMPDQPLRAAERRVSYIIAGAPDGVTGFEVDDDLDVYVNGTLAHGDNTQPNTPAARNPLLIDANIGDTLRFVVRDTYGVCSKLTTLFLIDPDGRSVVADPGFDRGCGLPNTNQGVSHDRSFVIPDLSVTPVAQFVGEIRQGPSSSLPNSFAVFKNRLYFAANDGINGDELWAIATTGAPFPVADIFPGSTGSGPRQLTVAGDTLYFVARTPNAGRELMAFDGTNSPVPVTDIQPGPLDSNPTHLTALGNQVVFRAEFPTGDEPAAYGSFGLRMFNIYPDSPSCDQDFGGCASTPWGFTAYDGILYFGAAEPQHGGALYQYDGTDYRRLTDSANGLQSPDHFTGIGRRLVFSGYNPFGWNQLFSYEIDNNPTGVATELVTGDQIAGAAPNFLNAVDDRAYFIAGDSTYGRELWVTDGTQAGTHRVTDLATGAAHSDPREFIGFNGELYFTATSTTDGREIHATNGVTTRLLANLQTGTAGFGWESPALFNQYIIFDTSNPGMPGQPWFTSGSSGRTGVIRQSNGSLINPTGAATDDPEFVSFNGAVYFAATDGIRGVELWRATLGASSPTTTTLSSSLNPSLVGDLITLSATVSGSGATPGGMITFLDGAATLGTVALVNGTATLQLSSLGRGSHTLTARYNGDGSNAASTSAALVQDVNGLPSSTQLVSSENPSTVGTFVTFTATVAGVSGGSVTFRDGGVELATVGLNAGATASFTTSTLTIGIHPITASYAGNAIFAGSTSNTISQDVRDVGGIATSTTLASAPNPSTVGQAVTLTATVAGPNNPSGSVIFRDGGVAISPLVMLAGGSATFVTSTLGSGVRQLTAAYSGDATHDSSVSPPVQHTVNRLSQQVGLFSSRNPAKIGESVTFTATFNADATGNVTFFDGAVSLGSAAVAGGQTTINVATLAVGTHAIIARYDGDNRYLPADSAPLNQVVNPLNSAPQIAPIADVTVLWGDAIAFGVFANDIDGDPVTFSLLTGPAGASITPSGQFTWTPDSTQTGTPTVVVSASDGALSSTRSFSITVQAHRTSIGQFLPFQAAPGPVVLRARIVDLDRGVPLATHSLLFQVGTQSVTAVTDAAGFAEPTLTLTQGSGTVAYTVSFAGSPAYLASTQSTTFIINLPPTIAPVAPQQVVWGRTLTFSLIVTDPEGVVPGVALLNAPGFILNGTFVSWTPAVTDTGQTTITVRATDGFSVVTMPITIDVLPHATSLTIGGPALYGSGPIEILATLRDSEFDVPLAGRSLALGLGDATATGTTDVDGQGIGRLNLQQPAGPTQSSAAFAGELGYAGSTASRPFTIIEDSDGDGLPDQWESEGVTVNGEFLDLPAMGANPLRKDIFIEVDWMLREPVCLIIYCYGSVPPQPAALATVIAAYAAAPVANPDGSTGITLHIDAGPGSVMDPVSGALWGARSNAGEVPWVQQFGTLSGFNYDWSAFDTYKQTYFVAARRSVFHYAIYVDHIGQNLLSTPTGISRGFGASDFIVAYSAWLSVGEEAGVFAHELGHNLMLRHGGDDHLNNKPNYESVMNYLWVLPGLPPDGRLDYSRSVLADVDESVAGDVNGDGLISILRGHEDWPNLFFGGQGLGDLFAPPAPRATRVDELPAEELRRRGVRPGDGTVDLRGPMLIVADSGARSLVVKVRNLSGVDAGYAFTIESPGLQATLGGTAFVPANGLLQLDVPFSTAGLVPGRYPIRIALRGASGALLHEQNAFIDIIEIATPQGRANADALLDALGALAGNAPIDAAVRSALASMLSSGKRYAFDGFFAPIDMSTSTTIVWNGVKAGQAVPIKWRLLSNGAPVADPASFSGVSAYRVSCTAAAAIDAPVEQTAAGNAVLTYNGDGDWQFNWKTPSAYKGTCQVMFVRFTDGSRSPEVRFKFK